MNWVWYLLGKLFAQSKKSSVTIEQLYQAVAARNLPVLETPKGGWPRRKGHLKLANDDVSIFYIETEDRGDGKKAESLDVHALAHGGGAWITFVDDELVALTHNAIERDVANLNAGNRQHLRQILFKVRHAVGRDKAVRN